MKKTSLSRFIVIILLIGIVGMACDNGNSPTNPTGGGDEPILSFTLHGDTYYSVSKGTANAAWIIIPETYNGLPVWVIDDSGFAGSDIYFIDIPNSINLIGTSAFYGCTNLRNVIIPNGVMQIQNTTFTDCYSLKSVTIPNSVTYIWVMAFTNCSSLMNITIPNTVVYLGPQAFAGCSSLKNLIIPNSVDFVGYGAFASMTSSLSIVIPFSTLAAADSAWGINWREACYSIILNNQNPPQQLYP